MAAVSVAVRSGNVTSAADFALQNAVDEWRVANHRAIAELRRIRAAELEAEIAGIKQAAADSFQRALDLGGSKADIRWALKDAGMSIDNRTLDGFLELARGDE